VPEMSFKRNQVLRLLLFSRSNTSREVSRGELPPPAGVGMKAMLRGESDNDERIDIENQPGFFNCYFDSCMDESPIRS